MSLRDVVFLPSKTKRVMNDKLLSRFCTFAILEGISYLFLLGIAMPLKYIGGNPILVHYGGWVHGLLFIGYLIFLIKSALRDDWKTGKIALAFFAAFIPFATFYVEWKLKKETKSKARLATLENTEE